MYSIIGDVDYTNGVADYTADVAVCIVSVAD